RALVRANGGDVHHERVGRRALEVLVERLLEHGGRERGEGGPPPYPRGDDLVHVGAPRVRRGAAGGEGARGALHPPPGPPADPPPPGPARRPAPPGAARPSSRTARPGRRSRGRAHPGAPDPPPRSRREYRRR